MVHYLTIIYIYDIYVCISCAIILIFNKTHKIGCCENCYWLGWFDIWRVKSGSLNYHGRFYVTRPFLYLERCIPIKTFVFLLLLCIEKARGETVRFFSPRCHIMPNGRMFHEKQWNDLHIYVKSGVIVYPQPRIHNSVGWAWSRVGA